MKTRFILLALVFALMMTGFCFAETPATEGAAQADDPALQLPEAKQLSLPSLRPKRKRRVRP